MRHNREIKIDAPPCLFCDKPLKPRMRQVWVSLPPFHLPEEFEFIEMARLKLVSMFRNLEGRKILWRSYDERATGKNRTRPGEIAKEKSFCATLWVVGDFDGQSFIPGRTAPCFCSQQCAIEFAELAAARGFRVRQ